MWAAALAQPGHFSDVTVARPVTDDLEEGDVLVEVRAGGICGSDVPFFRGAPNRTGLDVVPGLSGPAGFPMHEVVGTVLASRHDGHRPGDQVVGWAERFDGLAELVVTGGDSLATHDPGWSAAEAVLLQPIACVLHAVDRLGDVTGKTCAVLGVGPIGALFTHVLRTRGAGRVIGVDRIDRSADAGALGIDEFVCADTGEWAAALTPDQRPQVVVEAVGHQVATLQHAIEACTEDGVVFYFGVPDSDIYPLDMERLVRQHLTLMAGGTLHRADALARADRYLLEHPTLAKTLVTHTFGRTEVQAAYEHAQRPAQGRFKVVLDLTDTVNSQEMQ